MTHMQGELESLRKSNEEYRTRLRDMELDNDELEGKERSEQKPHVVTFRRSGFDHPS